MTGGWVDDEMMMSAFVLFFLFAVKFCILSSAQFIFVSCTRLQFLDVSWHFQVLRPSSSCSFAAAPVVTCGREELRWKLTCKGEPKCISNFIELG